MKTDNLKPDPLTQKILHLVNKHAVPVNPGRRESGTFATLAKRLCVPDTGHVKALIETGRLKPLGPVNNRDPNGSQRYETNHLNDIKREVLASIAAQVVESYDGNPEQLPIAVSQALETYLANLTSGKAETGFSFQPARRVGFAAPAAAEEERPGLLRRAATVAGAAGVGYGALAYLRGRKAGAVGILPALKAGNALNVASVRKGVAKAASYIRPRPIGGVPVGMSAKLTPAKARALLLAFGREIRRNGLA